MRVRYRSDDVVERLGERLSPYVNLFPFSFLYRFCVRTLNDFVRDLHERAGYFAVDRNDQGPPCCTEMLFVRPEKPM